MPGPGPAPFPLAQAAMSGSTPGYIGLRNWQPMQEVMAGVAWASVPTQRLPWRIGWGGGGEARPVASHHEHGGEEEEGLGGHSSDWLLQAGPQYLHCPAGCPRLPQLMC